MSRRELLKGLASMTVAVAAWRPAGLLAGTVVTGTVAGSDVGFLTGARVAIEGPLQGDATTDADGRFTFTEVTPGRYRLLVTADGYLPLDRPMDVSTAPVSVDIVLLRLPGV